MQKVLSPVHVPPVGRKLVIKVKTIARFFFCLMPKFLNDWFGECRIHKDVWTREVASIHQAYQSKKVKK